MRWLAVVLLLAGCAAPSWRTPVDNTPDARIIQPDLGTPCVPPGMAPLAEWYRIAAEPTMMADAAGRLLIAVQAGYYVQSTPVLAWWLNGALAIVDPDAQNPDVPRWYDPGLVTAEGRLTPGGGPTCEWRRGGETVLPSSQ